MLQSTTRRAPTSERWEKSSDFERESVAGPALARRHGRKAHDREGVLIVDVREVLRPDHLEAYTEDAGAIVGRAVSYTLGEVR